MTLFDYADTYPNVPGFKARSTSIAAADSMRGRALNASGKSAIKWAAV